MFQKLFRNTTEDTPRDPSGEAQPLGTDTRLSLLPRNKLTRSLGFEAWAPWALSLLLALAIVLVYSNSLYGPFTYDDTVDVLENTSIRHLWPLSDVFYTPGKGFMNRPSVNLTFALDYALGGLRPFLFHLTNLGIHLGAALTLFGVMRRSLSLPTFKGRFAAHLPSLALVTTALWALHPLVTESVSYITQRYESLMAMFVLLTFYCVLRGLESPYPKRWNLLAALACLLALGSKEVAVSVPILVFLFDIVFISHSSQTAWRDRKVLYLGMALAWACFAFIQLHVAKRSFAGFELTTPWWRYALNQPSVILHYLRLAVWPHPLIFDYLWPVAKTWKPLLPGLLAIAGLLGFTLWALVRRPALAFPPIFFLAILAPTSSIMPILDLAVEHRMYLPLVPVIVSLVLVVHALWTRWTAKHPVTGTMTRLLMLTGLSVIFTCLGILTYLRNEDYRDPIDLWRSVAEAVPNNPRGHNNYGYNLAEAGYLKEAITQTAKAVALAPGMALFQSNYGLTLAKNGQFPEALEHLRIAVRLEPTDSKYIANLGFVLLLKGSLDNAETCFNTARQINPMNERSYAGLASVMEAKHEGLKANGFIQQGIALNPYNPAFRVQQAFILVNLGDIQGARKAFQAFLKLESSAEKISEIGWSMHNYSLDHEALAAERQALAMKPGNIKSQIRLAWILATSADPSVRNGPEAVRLAEQVLQSQPIRSPEFLDLLAVSLAEAGRFQEARATLQEALTQAKANQESWIPKLETQLSLFERNEPFHETAKSPLGSRPAKAGMQ